MEIEKIGCNGTDWGGSPIYWLFALSMPRERKTKKKNIKIVFSDARLGHDVEFILSLTHLPLTSPFMRVEKLAVKFMPSLLLDVPHILGPFKKERLYMHDVGNLVSSFAGYNVTASHRL